MKRKNKFHLIDLTGIRCRIFLSLLSPLFILLACGGGGGGGDAPELFSISGTVYPSPSNNTDSDINNPNTSFTRNNDFENAQQIKGPVILGGYLSQKEKGPSHPQAQEGHCYKEGDSRDIYQLFMTGTETIRIFVPYEIRNQPIDLLLYEGSNTTIPIDEVPAVRNSAALMIPHQAEGEYFIEIRLTEGTGYSGYTAYKLYIGQFEKMSALKTHNLFKDFQPYEVVVKFNETLASLSDKRSDEITRTLSMGIKKEIDTKTALFQFEDPTYRTELFNTLGIAEKEPRIKDDRNESDRIHAKRVTLQVISALQSRSDIDYAGPNYIYRPLAIPTDPYFSRMWNLEMINWEPAWDINQSVTQEVVVAVIDTGIVPHHPDLNDRLFKDSSGVLQGYDFIDNDNDPTEYSSQTGYHGTHVAGTIAAEVSSNTGITGVAWNARIMPIRVLSETSGDPSDIAEGIKYAAGLDNRSGEKPLKKADIINLSIGSYGSHPYLEEAIKAALAEDITIIAASGNDNKSVPAFPAAYDGVIAVGAVDINGEKTYYSNYGTDLDIVAPGGDMNVDLDRDGYSDGILSTISSDDYAYYQGTSMASPHVAGVVALMKAVSTPTEVNFNAIVQKFMEEGGITRDFGAQGKDLTHGYGIVDAYKAIATMNENIIPQTMLSIIPKRIQFSALDNTKQISIEKLGFQNLTVADIRPNVSWLLIEKTDNVGEDGIGNWNISVDRRNLSEGIHWAEIDVTGSDQTVSKVKIEIEVFRGEESDIGLQYLLLLKWNESSMLYQSMGEYNYGYQMEPSGHAFSFNSLEKGIYKIMTISDIDFDGVAAIDGYEALGQTNDIDLFSNSKRIVFFSGFSNNPIPAVHAERDISITDIVNKK